MNATQNAKGDIYVIVAKSRNHPVTKDMDADGSVFARSGKNMDFEKWRSTQRAPHFGSAELVNCSPAKLGYLDLEADAFAGHDSSFSGGPVVVGVLIPCDVDKKAVADELRTRFGAGTILLKPGPDLSTEGRSAC